jgi:hypothetical protein
MKLTARKFNGDDQHSWAIFRDGQSRPVVTGLSKRQIPYYKRLIQQTVEKKESQQ